MEIHVIAVGKLRRDPLRLACEDYLTRLRPLLRVTVSEVRDTAALRSRAERLGGIRTLLDERGEHLDSPGLAGFIGDLRGRGTVRTLSMCIGGADGFDDSDRKAADRVLSLSKLTLPHRLARLVLLEQLYRAGTILTGHPYHHA